MTNMTHAVLMSLWVEMGGDPGAADVGAAVAQAESSGDPTRINNTAYPKLPGYHQPSPGSQAEYSVGLWQINELAHPQYTTAALLVPFTNAAAAIMISNNGSSFGAWSTYTNGSYKRYLSGGGSTTPAPGTTGPKGTPAVIQPKAVGAWSVLNKAIAVSVPTALRRSNAIRRATLRALK